jgi:hypothetical protein
MAKTALKVIAGLAALGALALGGSALAGAASNGSTSGSGTAPLAAPPGAGYGAAGPGPGGPPGGHIGRNGKRETPLTGDTATKVKDAALAKVPGGTLERVETDVDHGSPYEAHIRKSDGTELEVLVNKDFQVTAVNAMRMR